MNNIIFSILLVLIGIFIGIICIIVINYFRGINSSKKIDAMLEKAKKDADKIKRDYLLEAKEEAHKIKQETDKEVKEKKAEIKESEERTILPFTRTCLCPTTCLAECIVGTKFAL